MLLPLITTRKMALKLKPFKNEIPITQDQLEQKLLEQTIMFVLPSFKAAYIHRQNKTDLTLMYSKQDTKRYGYDSLTLENTAIEALKKKNLVYRLVD